MTQAGCDLSIRLAIRDDLPAIMEIEDSSFESAGERFSSQVVLRLMSNPRARVTVAMAGSAIAGWAAGLVRQSATGKVSGRVYSVATHPDHRGKGVGRSLCEDLLDWFTARGTSAAYLEVRANNESAKRLYARLGFVTQRFLPGYYGLDADGLRMRKSFQDKT